MRDALLVLLAALTSPLSAQRMEARLYRPWKPELAMTYAPAQMDERRKLTPILYLCGTEMPEGDATLSWTVLGGRKVLAKGECPLKVAGGFFEHTLALDQPCPGADRVHWRLTRGKAAASGETPLAWSRFKGTITYEDGLWRPTYINLHPHTFGASERFRIPIPEGGRFDVEVPAGIYGVLNLNGAGYSVDAMERWGWSFDLRKDREEAFRVGRTELFSIHAFGMRGGPSTVFVAFRPTCLTKVLRHTYPPGAGPKAEGTMALIAESLKSDPASIAPDLRKENLKVWLDGTPETVTELNRITESNNLGIPQVQYILQITPATRPARGRWHEVKLEVESQDVLGGKLVKDFGQGSAGFFVD